MNLSGSVFPNFLLVAGSWSGPGDLRFLRRESALMSSCSLNGLVSIGAGGKIGVAHKGGDRGISRRFP